MAREKLLLAIDGMEVGGSQRQVQQLLKGLDRRRWAPELVYFRAPSFLVEEIRDAGVPVHYLPKHRRVDPLFLASLAQLLRRGDYALIHAFSLTAELACAIARPLSGRRPLLIASERSFALDRTAWFWWLKRQVLRRSAAVVANSLAGARATAQRTGMPGRLFAIVANGVDVPPRIAESERRAIRRELGVAGDRCMGLFVGRLVAVKNLPCLVRALQALPSTRRPRIILVGDGPERASVEALAAQLGVANDLCFLGERGDVARLLQAADFLVLTSYFEGLSNAVLEAMAAGCPAIASAVGGTPELVEDGRTGLLFRSDDALALSWAMARMTDGRLRARLSQAASQRVAQRHTSAALGAATEAVYQRCLSLSRGAGARLPAHPVRGPAK